MRQVRELLRLSFEQNISARKAAKIIGIGRTAASQYISGFKASGLNPSAVGAMSDSELLNAINTKKESDNLRYKELFTQFTYFEKELKRTGGNLQLLWQEYTATRADYYGYSQFCHHYYHWRKEKKVSMRMDHKAGDKMFVDFTGKKLQTVNPGSGEVIEYEVFVAVLGASQLSYIEAVPSQTKADWVMVNENAIRFYGGVSAAVVPDCLKSSVIKADKYEPQINDTFNDFASHYQTTILPARALHPQDKSLAENFVRRAYTHICPLAQPHIRIKESSQGIFPTAIILPLRQTGQTKGSIPVKILKISIAFNPSRLGSITSPKTNANASSKRVLEFMEANIPKYRIL